MNEPFEGLCGWDDLNHSPDKHSSTLKKGTFPTPAQSLRLGMGQAQTVDNWTFGALGPSRDGSVTIDPKGIKIWAEPDTEVEGVHPKWGWKRDPGWALGTCLWAQHGVWDIESGYMLRPDYFKWLPDSDSKNPCALDFIADYWRPHWHAYADRIRASHPEAILFVQPPVFAIPPPIDENVLRGRCAYSPHYYDGLTLVTRHWNWFNADALGLLRGKYTSKMQALKIGQNAIRKSFQEQLAILKDDALILGPYPTVLGEIGTPFDMDGKRSYGWTDHGKYKGDYSRQEKALDASLNGADGENVMNWSAWTFCPDGSHDWGDGWNMEDLSLWCPDDLRPTAEESSLFGLADASDARLLPQHSNGMANGGVAVAASSSLSLATLALGGRTTFDEVAVQKAAMSSLGVHENPYDFLTDGARAVRAFCRPYPIKVIGRAREIKFDINKAEFKMSVVVRAEDKPREGDEELATEIFVPLVHFAHDRLLFDARGVADVDANKSGNLSQLGSLNASSISLKKIQPGQQFSPSLPVLDASYSRGTSVTAGSRTPSLRAGMEGTPVLEGDLEVVNVEVRMNGGRWAVEGQKMKWWYDVPEEGEPERVYEIEIRRGGGAIRVRSGERSWFEELCAEWCCCLM